MQGKTKRNLDMVMGDFQKSLLYASKIASDRRVKENNKRSPEKYLTQNIFAVEIGLIRRNDRVLFFCS